MEPCFSLEELRKRDIANIDHTQKLYYDIKSLYEKILVFIPDASVHYRLELGPINKDRLFVSRPYVVFFRNGCKFRMERGEYCGRFCFDIKVDISDLQNIDWKSEHAAREFLTAPISMYKLSKDRLEEWISYLTKYRRNLEAIDAKNLIRKNEIMKGIHALEGVHWNHDGRRGSYHKNGLCYIFKITDTCIEEKIQVSLPFQVITLKTFLQLTDNKYNE